MAMKIIRKAILNASEAKRARGAMEGAMCPFLPKRDWGSLGLLFELWRLRVLAAFILAFRGISMTDLEGSRSKFQGTHF